MSENTRALAWCVAGLAALWLVLGAAQPWGLIPLAALGVFPPRINPVQTRMWWWGAAAVWFVVVCLPPLLSDDVYRYIVDGSMSRAGFNPFAWAPAAPVVADIAPAARALTNHPELPTIYPAAAQALFGAFAFNPLVWKAATAGAWFTGAWLLDRQGGRPDIQAGRSQSQAMPRGLWLAVHPLALLAAGVDGHVDAWGAMALGIGLVGRDRTDTARQWFWGILVGVAAGIKYFPIIALPARGLRWRSAVAALALLALTSLPLLASAGIKSFGSLTVYQTHWSYNGAIFETTAALLRPTNESTEVACRSSVRHRVFDGVPSERCFADSGATGRRRSRMAWAAALVATLLFALRSRLSGSQHAARFVTLGFTVLILSAPTAHAWYFLWILVPAVVWNRREAVALASCGVLAFWAPTASLGGGEWMNPWWPSPIAIGAAFSMWLLRSRIKP
jgi:hypothetical protein